MLQFESDDFLEINDADIMAIQRSRAPVNISVASGRSFEVRAVLCQQKADKQSVCQLAVYSTLFKRALVFGLSEAAEPKALFRRGAEYLKDLGFQLEPLNLDLKPALRETVLRDLPALQTPENVRRMRKERRDRIASLENTLKMLGKPAPSSKEGLEHKRTTEQLNAERKAEVQLQSLREHLEKQFSTFEKTLEPLPKAPVAPPVDEVKAPQVSGKKEKPPDASQPVGRASAVDSETPKRGPEPLEQPPTPAASRSGQTAAADRPPKPPVREEQREGRLLKDGKQAQEEPAAVSKELTAARQELTETRQDLATSERALEDTRKELATAERELTGLRIQLAARDGELAVLKPASDALAEQLKAAELQTKAEEKKRLTLEGELKKLRTELSEIEQRHQQLDAQLATARQEVEQERREKAALVEEAARNSARLKKLEADLPQLRAEAKEAVAGKAEKEQLQGRLEQLRSRYETLTRENALLVEEHAAARKQLAALEQQPKSVQQQSRPDIPEPVPDAARKTTELQRQLAKAERELKELAGQQRQLAEAYTEERQKSQSLQEELEQARQAERPAAPAAAKQSVAKKPPHELRRPPLPGAFFHVDWDLTGLPCPVAQVSQVWRSIYNVTLSIEGYPHQYVGALIVLLKKGEENRLFMLFRLEDEGRNLVYRPARPIDSDAALQKGLEEARKFLRVSGIEIESVTANQLGKILQPYLPQD